MHKIILAIGAHPDDIDAAAAGTIAKWVEEGATAYYLIATDGSKGTNDPSLKPQDLIALRKTEQQKAAKILGVKEVFFLDNRDTELMVTQELKEQLVRYIRKIKPDVVITLSPELYFKSDPEDDGYINHTDHRNLAIAVMDSVFPLARDPLTFPHLAQEGLLPHKVKELLFFNLVTPSYTIDISHTFAKKKQAMLSFKSQFTGEEGIQWLIEANTYFGKHIGTQFAENFTRIILH